MLRIIYTLFAKRLRLSNPWNYKAPVLIGFTYVVIGVERIPFLVALQAIGWSLLTIVGIAGFGYLTNDLGDRKADLAAGKANLLATLPMAHIAGLLLLFLGLALVPWVVFFPVSALSLGLLGAELLLFVLYVAPPFRLKERGFLGLVTDSLYAHALPCLLAMITFAAIAGERDPFDPDADIFPYMVMAVAWQFALGLRNILLHQMKDAENDRQSGLRTLVTRIGDRKTFLLLTNLMIPLEAITWSVLIFGYSRENPLPLLIWPGFVAFQYIKRGRPADNRTFLYRLFDDFYIPILPSLFLLWYALFDWHLLILLGDPPAAVQESAGTVPRSGAGLDFPIFAGLEPNVVCQP
ncbi:MAG: UbiA family prenyltransferase [Bacteroidia bacterium]